MQPHYDGTADEFEGQLHERLLTIRLLSLYLEVWEHTLRTIGAVLGAVDIRERFARPLESIIHDVMVIG